MPVPRHSLSCSACFLGNALAGCIADGSDNLQTRKPEVFESELGDKTCGGSGYALAGAACSDPVAKVREVVRAIDVIECTPAEHTAVGSVEYDEVVLLPVRPRRRSGLKPRLAVRHGVVGRTPRSPLR